MRRAVLSLSALLTLILVSSCGQTAPGTYSIAPYFGEPRMGIEIQGGAHIVVEAMPPAEEDKVLKMLSRELGPGKVQVTVDLDLDPEELREMWNSP